MGSDRKPVSMSVWLQKKNFQDEKETFCGPQTQLGQFREALVFVSTAEFLDENLVDWPRPKPVHHQKIFWWRPLCSR